VAETVGIWEPISTEGEPRSRAGHTAVWTEREMIIWGGYDENTGEFFGEGARFRLE